RHARAGRRVRPRRRGPAGSQGRLPGGSRVAPGLDRRRHLAPARRRAGEEWLRRLSPQADRPPLASHPVDIAALPIDGAWTVTPRQFDDDRGVFLEWFRADRLAEAIGRPFDVVQA